MILSAWLLLYMAMCPGMLMGNSTNGSIPQATCTLAKNVDLRSRSLDDDKAAKIKADTAEDCCTICGAHPSCASFSWRRWNDFKSGDCYLNVCFVLAGLGFFLRTSAESHGFCCCRDTQVRTAREPEPRVSEDCPEHGGDPLCGFVSGCVRKSASGKCTEEPPLGEVLEQPSVLLPLIFAAIPALYMLGGVAVGRAVG